MPTSGRGRGAFAFWSKAPISRMQASGLQTQAPATGIVEVGEQVHCDRAELVVGHGMGAGQLPHRVFAVAQHHVRADTATVAGHQQSKRAQQLDGAVAREVSQILASSEASSDVKLRAVAV